MLEETFRYTFTAMAEYIHETAKPKGWCDSNRNNGELIALCHSELSEALEALRRRVAGVLRKRLSRRLR